MGDDLKRRNFHSTTSEDGIALLETGVTADNEKVSEVVGKLLYDICRISAKYDIYPEEALTDTIEDMVKG